MTNTKHTPGPWRATPRTPAPWVDVDRNDGRTLAVVQAGVKEDLPALANARLIAAAPDLLEALYSILNLEGVAKWGAKDYMPGLDVYYHFQKIRAAIRKATGEA